MFWVVRKVNDLVGKLMNSTKEEKKLACILAACRMVTQGSRWPVPVGVKVSFSMKPYAVADTEYYASVF